MMGDGFSNPYNNPRPDADLVRLFKSQQPDQPRKRTPVARVATINFVIDGNGLAITTGSKGYLQVDFPCEILSWTTLADQTGSIDVNILKAAYAAFPTTTSIVASAHPTLSSARKNTSVTLTGWTTAIGRNDILEYSVVSATTVTRVTVSLKVRRREPTTTD